MLSVIKQRQIGQLVFTPARNFVSTRIIQPQENAALEHEREKHWTPLKTEKTHNKRKYKHVATAHAMLISMNTDPGFAIPRRTVLDCNKWRLRNPFKLGIS